MCRVKYSRQSESRVGKIKYSFQRTEQYSEQSTVQSTVQCSVHSAVQYLEAIPDIQSAGLIGLDICIALLCTAVISNTQGCCTALQYSAIHKCASLHCTALHCTAQLFADNSAVQWHSLNRLLGRCLVLLLNVPVLFSVCSISRWITSNYAAPSSKC